MKASFPPPTSGGGQPVGSGTRTTPVNLTSQVRRIIQVLMAVCPLCTEPPCPQQPRVSRAIHGMWPQERRPKCKSWRRESHSDRAKTFGHPYVLFLVIVLRPPTTTDIMSRATVLYHACCVRVCVETIVFGIEFCWNFQCPAFWQCGPFV